MKRSRQLLGLVLLAVALTLSACGSISKTAYNGLVTLKAAYVPSNALRNDYCRPKEPKPKVCVDSNVPFSMAYHVLAEGTRLLSVYVVNKDKATGDLLVALTAEIPSLVGQIVLAVGEVKAASGVPITADVPPPVK